MPIRIGSSQRNDMRALSYQGAFATDCYPQLRALLERHGQALEKAGMPGAASFLAEPMHDAAAGVIDWYAQGRSARRLDALTGTAREDLLARLAACAAAIASITRGQDSTHLGLLRCAMRVPDLETSLYAVDGRPVLANWGFAPGSGGAVPEDILRLGARAQPAALSASPAPEDIPAAAPTAPAAPSGPPVLTPAPAPAPLRSFAWLLDWLLPLLLLLLLLWFLLAALGLLPSPLPAGCLREDPVAEDTRRGALDDEHASLLERLRGRADECRRPAAARDGGVSPLVAGEEREDPVPETMIPSFTEGGVTRGDLPAEPEMPFFGDDLAQRDVRRGVQEDVQEAAQDETLAEGEPFFGDDAQVQAEPRERPQRPSSQEPYFGDDPSSPVAEEKSLEIPEAARGASGLTFLEGCWSASSGLVESATGTPVIVEYCFGPDGRGRRYLREQSSGAVCEGTARATRTRDGVDIEADPAYCRGANVDEYVPQRIECRGSGADTRCRSREQRDNGKVVDWDADFTRRERELPQESQEGQRAR